MRFRHNKLFIVLTNTNKKLRKMEIFYPKPVFDYINFLFNFTSKTNNHKMFIL